MMTTGELPAGGAPNAQAAQAPQASADPLESLRAHLNSLDYTVNNALAPPGTAAAAPIPPAAAAAGAPTRPIEGVGQALTRVQQSHARVGGALERLAALLSREGTLNEPAQRAEAQQLIGALGPVLQSLGGVYQLLAAHTLNSRLGESPAQAQLLRPAPRPVQLSVPLFHVRRQPGPMPPGGAAAGPNGAQPAGAAINLGPALQPLFQMMGNVLRQPQPGQQPQDPQAPQQQPPAAAGSGAAVAAGVPTPVGQPGGQAGIGPVQNLNNFMQLLGPMLQQFSSAAGVGHQPGQPPQQPQPQQQSSSQQAAPQPSTPAQPTTRTAQSTSAVLAGGSPPTTSPRLSAQQPQQPLQPAQPQQAPQSQQNQQQAQQLHQLQQLQHQQGGGNHSSLLMAQMFNVVNQALGQGASGGAAGGGAGAPTLTTILGSVANNVDAEPGAGAATGDIFQLAMDSLTLPDVMQIFQGNW